MRIERFEDIDPPAVWRIEAWQLARELTRKVYGLTKKTKFAGDFGLKGQIQMQQVYPVKCEAYLTGVHPKGSEVKVPG